jgi:hypothetical protein
MAIEFHLKDIACDPVNPPILQIYPDLSLPDGVSVSGVRATIKATAGENVQFLSGAVLRRSSVPPARIPSYAERAKVTTAGADTLYNFPKLSNATAGFDNKLVLWARLATPGNDIVAQFPFVGKFGGQHLRAEKAALAAKSHQQVTGSGQNETLLDAISARVGNLNSLNNIWFIRDLGKVEINKPLEGNPAPANVPISPVIGMPYYSIQEVAGNLTDGSPICAWAVVMRSAAPIPQFPTGFPTPVQATLLLGTYFLLSGVPGAVYGLDNKLVVWAQFMYEPQLTIATRSFCGV